MGYVFHLTTFMFHGIICLLKAIEQIATTQPTDGVMYGCDPYVDHGV